MALVEEDHSRDRRFMGRRAVGPAVVLDSPVVILERGAMSMNPLGKVAHTGRGFEIIEFQDRYGKFSSLQQSSLAEQHTPGTSAVWLGLDAVNDKPARMHLDRKQVKDLILRLGRWLDTGSFEL
jgi:hypothetical protein